MAAGVAWIEEIDHLFQSLADEFDKIDVLFINAGVGELTHLGDMTEKVYDEVFAINTKGAYFTMQKSLPFLNNGAFSHSDSICRARWQGHSGKHRQSRSYPHADLRSLRPAR